MMFSRTTALTISALPLLAAVTPLEARASCSTGALQCCQGTETAGSAAGSALLGLVGVVVQDATVELGVTCSPISVIGVGGSDGCSANVVCCDDNNHGGLVSIGCVPATL